MNHFSGVVFQNTQNQITLGYAINSVFIYYCIINPTYCHCFDHNKLVTKKHIIQSNTIQLNRPLLYYSFDLIVQGLLQLRSTFLLIYVLDNNDDDNDSVSMMMQRERSCIVIGELD